MKKDDMKTNPQLSADDFKSVIRNTPLVSIDFIIRNKSGRMLVGNRTNEPAKGFLFVPGGRIRKNESMAQAFSRLTASELGKPFEIGQARFIGVFEHFYDTDAFEGEGASTHYVVLAYALTVAELDLAGNDQHSEFLWLTDEELRNNKFVHENTRAYAGI